ncbi:hypothetical protein COCHEDRAFT_1138647 [Bipolaris maydis C5]|uniref:RNA-dependent RNA polymerase n=2 Tax=Cochliobolus heterostrophus TaxID=5016 RepID=M2UPW7_COCH5|nr:hypothetical protein COCHEDRAFT_1138647 [Bipolaris maydis C5]KAJ5025392.1 RNA dependent RNA polymerase-domain-containing protein [Bipolaris maydis]KAJ6269608.1 RNA dependent RNA polymerase-domain-containing protein [Bipolaris maydis]KAJ6280579.1 RNA dependent RNA polymerase-domain-containing protein [Bipolaris maydis]
MSSYGNVFRIEMETSRSGSYNAYVVFRPPPHSPIPCERLQVGAAHVRCEVRPPLAATIPSSINPAKKYYELTILSAKRVEFGVRVAEKAMIAMHTVEPPAKDGVQVMLNLKRKQLDVLFSLRIPMDDKMRKFRFSLPISLISHIYKTKDSTGLPSLVIPFDSTPCFYMQKNEGEDLGDGRKQTSFSRTDKIWSDWDTWYRVTDIVDGAIRAVLRRTPVMNHRDTAIIDIGRWTNYRLIFDNSLLSGLQFKNFSDALADYGVEIKDLIDYPTKRKIPSPLWSLLSEEIYGTHPHLDVTPSNQGMDFNNIFARQAHLSFPVRYQLEVCLSNGYIKEHNITIGFLKKLEALESQQAVHILEKVADRQKIYYDPMEIFDIPIKGIKRKMPSYCLLQRSVTITPTMMHVATPVMETSNRIIRKYEADADRFIRVRFTDEKNEGQLRNQPNGRAEAVFDRVFRAMKNGIVVAGRYYEFLAFGNSQFRENGAYFYAPTSSKSANDIRISLGEFDHIKTVSKFAARLGQCFSTTRAMGVTVELTTTPDKKHNNFIFTDGVGKLSPFLAQMAAQELGLANAFTDPPSLFQFRLGGSKGVLALDPKLKRNQVKIRPSQYKFRAPYTGLEIIRSSSFATPYFNRQIILVLSYLGVQDAVFLRKQEDMMNDYSRAMADETTALQKLRKNIDINQTTLTMAAMVLDGFMGSREPFIMSLLALWRACTIKNLKEKARIAIDNGAFLLGCVDETKKLKGHFNDPQSRRDATRDEKLATLPEIFLQVSDPNSKGHYIIIEGICIVARNPSLHPGDVRVVRAVNVEELHHLKNVVVFPQTGDRDLANMCSGGDLDGDDYMVLWDTDLLPERINEPPMDFTPEKAVEIDGPISALDMARFFVNYIKNDALGPIAHAHLAQADFNENGVGDPICLELAELHSRAVDFPKSGIPAEMKRELRPKKWPHFMEKKYLSQHQIYKSKKILGLLYDEVKLIDFEPQWENPFDKRILEAFDLDQELLDKAASLKLSYDEALRRLMAKHGIKTEFEAWSVFVLVHNHESGDYKFAEEFGRTIAALKHQFRSECSNAAELSDNNDWARLGPFVAAMYTVTAHEMENALDECTKTKTVGGRTVPLRIKDPEHMPLISFPWLFPSELGKIATGGRTSHQPNRTSSQPRQTKHVRPAKSGAEIGAVETAAGTTHYGEVLDLEDLIGLDFSLAAPQASDPVPTPEMSKSPNIANDNIGA